MRNKFTKKSKRRNPIRKYSKEFMEEKQIELRKDLAKAKTPTEEKQIIQAFNISYLK